jgi:hypothetical protein
LNSSLPIPASHEAATELANQITSGTLTLDELADIADASIVAQNAFARARIYAERQIVQQYLFNANEYQQAEGALKKRGWSSSRIGAAKRSAQLSLIQIDEYVAGHTASAKEATAAGARALLPITPKPDRANFATNYTAPPVDVAIAQQWGMQADDDYAELIAASIAHALHQDITNPRHAYVWAKYHGLQDDGTVGERWTFEGIASQMTPVCTREYVESLYYRAHSAVCQRMSRDLLNALRLMLSKD